MKYHYAKITMNLLSRARSLLESGTLATASVIAISPLATAVTDAALVFDETPQSETSIFNKEAYSGSGSIFTDTTTSFSQSGGSYYSFYASIGGATETDNFIFGSIYNSSRNGNITISGSCSGTLNAGDKVLLDYSVTTLINGVETTTVSYQSTFGAFDSSALGSYAIGASLGDSVGSSTFSGSSLGGDLNSDAGPSGLWIVNIDFDWNLEDYITSGYSGDYTLSIVIDGSLSVVSGVPEPSTWGLIGASAAFGTVLIGKRRKKNKLPA